MCCWTRKWGLTESRGTHRSVPATGETGEIRSIKTPIPPLFPPPLDNLELLSSLTHPSVAVLVVYRQLTAD